MVSSSSAKDSDVYRPDLTLTIVAPDGRRAQLVVEAKGSVEPRDVPRLLDQFERYRAAYPDASFAVATRYVSPRSRQLLSERDLNYVDATGNVRLVIGRPGLYIETSGAERNPWRITAALQSLKGRGAARATRALCDFTPPFRLGQLAEATDTPLPTISRVAGLLEREGLLVREGARGPVKDVEWEGVIRRWSQDYSVVGSNQASSYLAPRGLDQFIDQLIRRPSGAAPAPGYAVTGSFAANRLAPVTESRLLTIFVGAAAETASAWNLRPAERGANVMLLEPYDGVACERVSEERGVTYAALSQVVVDLLTGPGRSPAEAEALIGWMKANERSWRLTIATA